MVVFAVSVGSAGLVRAQGAEPSAVELGERAKRAQDGGRLDEAIDGWAKAYQVSGEAPYLFSLAEAHRQAGHLEDALRMYQTYVRRDPTGPNRAIAERQIKELEPRVADAKKTGVGSAPPLPAARPVTPAPAVVPPPAPAAATTPAPGVDLTAPAAPAPVASIDPPLPRWVPWALATATAGLGAAAIVTGLSASSRYDELHDSCGKTAAGCSTADISDLKSRARRANILWALTSAAAVGAGVTFYLNVSASGASGVWSF